MGEIQQGTFCKIVYSDGKLDVIESFIKLEIGKLYKGKDNNVFKVVGISKFKYTYKDIDNIRVLMEGYDEGTVQDNLRKRMTKAFNSKTTSIRLSFEEKELLSYIYYENEYISESDKETLRKVLNIK